MKTENALWFKKIYIRQIGLHAEKQRLENK